MRPVSASLGGIPTWAVLLAILCVGAGFTTWQAEARPREAVAKDARLAGDRGRTRFVADLSKKVDVNVITHPFQRFAVWFGGSMLASQPEFLGYFHTRAQYAEQGPRIARHNQVTHTHEPAHKSATNQELCTLEKIQALTFSALFFVCCCAGFQRAHVSGHRRSVRCAASSSPSSSVHFLPQPERMRAALRLRHRLSAALKRLVIAAAVSPAPPLVVLLSPLLVFSLAIASHTNTV